MSVLSFYKGKIEDSFFFELRGIYMNLEDTYKKYISFKKNMNIIIIKNLKIKIKYIIS